MHAQLILFPCQPPVRTLLVNVWPRHPVWRESVSVTQVTMTTVGAVRRKSMPRISVRASLVSVWTRQCVRQAGVAVSQVSMPDTECVSLWYQPLDLVRAWKVSLYSSSSLFSSALFPLPPSSFFSSSSPPCYTLFFCCCLQPVHWSCFRIPLKTFFFCFFFLIDRGFEVDTT